MRFVELMEAILGRRSIRRFQDKTIDAETIEKIIDAARWAPSNTNRQGWRYIVVRDKTVMKEIVNNGGASLIVDAPTGILVLYDNRSANLEYKDYIQSAAASIQNILLRAHSLGLGSCWVCQLPNKKKMRQIFGIPRFYDPIAYLALGYAQTFPLPPPRKKQLSEIIAFDKFEFKEKPSSNWVKLSLKRFLTKIYFSMPLFLKKATRNFVEQHFVTKFGSGWTLEDVARHWDKVADIYDMMNARAYSYSRRFSDGYKLSNIKDGNWVLDICCRTGNGTLFFAKRKKIKAVCMDVSEKMLAITKEKLRRANVDFEVKKFKEMDLPFPDESFDYVLCFETIEHVPDPESLIQELSRVLRTGGEIILTTPTRGPWNIVSNLAALLRIHHGEGPHRFISREEIVRMFMLSELEIRREETTVPIPAGPRFFMRLAEVLECAGHLKFLNSRRVFICVKR